MLSENSGVGRFRDAAEHAKIGQHLPVLHAWGGNCGKIQILNTAYG
jgi:hypothetical protein